MAKEERVNHPAHYQGENGIEVIDVIRHYTCDIANALKYLMRAGRKQEDGMTDADKELEDLRKALWYIEDYEANCADETCGMAARPYMKSLVRDATGYSVRQICEGYPDNVAKAIELLLMVGLVRHNGIARVNNYEKYLDSAKKCVRKQVVEIESGLAKKEFDSLLQVLNGQAVDGEDYISKPACNRETEPEQYDPMNMITIFGHAYCLTKEIRRRPNGSLYTPCENCALMEYCFDDWRNPDEATCRHICDRLHQAESAEYYREVGHAAYRPSNGTIEIIDDHKEMELEMKRLDEEMKED